MQWLVRMRDGMGGRPEFRNSDGTRTTVQLFQDLWDLKQCWKRRVESKIKGMIHIGITYISKFISYKNWSTQKLHGLKLITDKLHQSTRSHKDMLRCNKVYGEISDLHCPSAAVASGQLEHKDILMVNTVKSKYKLVILKCVYLSTN